MCCNKAGISNIAMTWSTSMFKSHTELSFHKDDDEDDDHDEDGFDHMKLQYIPGYCH